MENIRSLIQNLNSKELEVVKNYIHGFSSRAGDEEKKTWKLMQMILKDKDKKTDDKYSQNIYNSDRDFKLEKSKSRLKNKILDSLVLDINIERRDAFDQNDNAALRISKKLVTVKYLIYSFQEYSYIYRLLNEIIDLSLKYENYPALIETSLLKKKVIIDNHPDEEHDINCKVDYYTGCMNYLREIEDLYYIKIISKKNCMIDKSALLFNIDQELRRIDSKYSEYRSPLAEYYRGVINYTRFKLNDNYELAEIQARQLLDFIPQHPSVDSLERIGVAQHFLAESLGYQGKYSESLTGCIAAQTYFSTRSANFLVSKELEFELSVQKGDIMNAKYCLNLLQRSVTPEQAFRISKFEYYSCCISFIEGNFNQSYKILRTHLEISKDKTGWDLAMRVLTILNAIELGFDNDASKYIELLRKQVKRKSSDPGFRKRTIAILKILMILDKKSFNFSVTYPYVKDLLDLLESNDPEYKKIFNGPELICLKSWFTSKL